jgi:hypothetical protein
MLNAAEYRRCRSQRSGWRGPARPSRQKTGRVAAVSPGGHPATATPQPPLAAGVLGSQAGSAELVPPRGPVRRVVRSAWVATKPDASDPAHHQRRQPAEEDQHHRRLGGQRHRRQHRLTAEVTPATASGRGQLPRAKPVPTQRADQHPSPTPSPVRRPGTPAGAAGGRRRHAHPGGRSARRRAARRRPGTRWRAHRRRPRPRAASSPATRPGGQPCHRSGEHGKRTGRDQLAGRPLNADRSPNGFALDMRHPFGSSGGSRSGSVPAADPSNRKVAVSLTNLPGSCRVTAGSVLGFRGNVSGSLRRSREPMPERFDAWQELSERL